MGFIIGMIVGGLIGACAMALVTAGGGNNEK